MEACKAFLAYVRKRQTCCACVCGAVLPCIACAGPSVQSDAMRLGYNKNRL